VAGVLSLAVVKSLMLAFVVGPMVDRFGPRRVIIVSFLAFAAGMTAFSMAPANVPIFYALFALVCGLGAPINNTTFGKALAGWFDKGRGAAMGFSAGLGTGSGSVIFPVLAGLLLSQFGWRAALLGVAATILLVGFPTMLAFLRDPPQKDAATARTAPEEADGFTLKEAALTRTFWTLVLSIALCASCITAMFTQVVPVVTEKGIALSHGVTVVTVFAGVCAIWQSLMGFLVDRIPRPVIILPFYLMGVLGLWLLNSSNSVPVLIAAGALMGLSLGAEYSALPLMLSRYFGIRHFGKIASTVYAGVSVGVGLIPVGMNAIYDATGTYDLALDILIVTTLISALMILFLPRHDRALILGPGDGRKQSAGEGLA